MRQNRSFGLATSMRWKASVKLKSELSGAVGGKKGRQRLKNQAHGSKRTERRGEKEGCSPSPPRLCGMTDFMRSSCVCQSRPGVFVGQFLREEEEEEGKNKVRKREPRH